MVLWGEYVLIAFAVLVVKPPKVVANKLPSSSPLLVLFALLLHCLLVFVPLVFRLLPTSAPASRPLFNLNHGSL